MGTIREQIAVAKSTLRLRVEVEKRLGPPKTSGKWHCPFHEGDNTPSLGISSGQKGERWKCYGCGRSGDVLDFITGFDNISLAQLLAGTLNLLPEEQERRAAAYREELQRMEQEERKQRELAFANFQKTAPWIKASKYLNASEEGQREWASAGIPLWYQKEFGLGYIQAHRYTFDKGKTYHESRALAIPYYEPVSLAIVSRMQLRLLDQVEGGPKYLPAMKDLPHSLFIANRKLHIEGEIILIEGEKKAMVTWIRLRDRSRQVVSFPGKSSLVDPVLLAQLSKATRIILIPDPDVINPPVLKNGFREIDLGEMTHLLGRRRTVVLDVSEKFDDYLIKNDLRGDEVEEVLDAAKPYAVPAMVSNNLQKKQQNREAAVVAVPAH